MMQSIPPRAIAPLIALALLAAGCTNSGDLAAGGAVEDSTTETTAVEGSTAPSSTADATTSTSSTPTSPTTETEAAEPSTQETDSTATTDPPDVVGTFDGQRCVEVVGEARCYLMLAPEGLADNVPLVIDMHGYGGNASGQRGVSGFDDLAISEGFVVAWPQGFQDSFNAGLCCGQAVGTAVDDVEFLRAVVADVSATIPAIDTDRLYLTGLSNGCAMAQRAAAEASDLFDAVACFSYYLLVDLPAEYSPVPIMEIHGELDPVVAYTEEGVGLSDLLGVEMGAETNIVGWAEANGCDATPQTTEADGYRLTSFGGCQAETALVSVPDSGHTPYPGHDTNVDTLGIAWDFLTSQTG